MGTNQGSNKVALYWLDIVLVVLVVACGLVVWSGAKRFTRWSRQYDNPVKERFEEASNVPLRRAELAMAQKELNKVQAKLVDEQMETVLLTAQIEAESGNIPDKSKVGQESKWSEGLQEHRTKLNAANATIRTLKSDDTQKMQRMIQASAAAFEAQHAANVAYSKCSQKFEFRNRIRTITLGSLGWLVLLVLAWFGCGLARKSLGQGHRSFVLMTSFLFLAALCVYELLK